MSSWAKDDAPVNSESNQTWKQKSQQQQQQQSAGAQVDSPTADKTVAADSKNKWANAKTVTEFFTDSENKRYEVTKKVRTYHVDRPVTTVDIRSKWAKFGKGVEPNKDLVSLDPPVVLELGSIDPIEKAARDEIVRLMADAERMKVTVDDPLLAEVAKRREKEIKEREEREEKEAVRPKEGQTWGSRERYSAAQPVKVDDSVRRIRVSNLSDEISEGELRNIFDTEDQRVEKLFIARDKKSGNYKGYAFITYTHESMVEHILQKTKGRVRFKNMVLIVDRAVPQKQSQ